MEDMMINGYIEDSTAEIKRVKLDITTPWW